MTVLVLPVAPVRRGQRVWVHPIGDFGEVDLVVCKNYHSWMLTVDGEAYAPSEIAFNVVEHPRRYRDTAPCEVLS